MAIRAFPLWEQRVLYQTVGARLWQRSIRDDPQLRTEIQGHRAFGKRSLRKKGQIQDKALTRKKATVDNRFCVCNIMSGDIENHDMSGKGDKYMPPYTIEEIKRRILPVARKYELSAVYLFGSYARGEATADSDVDLLVDLRGSTVRGMDLGGLYNDLTDALEKELDLVTVTSLEYPTQRRGQLHFREAVKRERVMIYTAA